MFNRLTSLFLEAFPLRLLKNAFASCISSLLSMLTGLAVIPLMIGYLGNDYFGIFIAVSSIGMIIGSVADFGVLHALIAMSARIKAQDGDLGIRQLTGSAVLTLTTIAVIELAVLFAFAPLVPWNEFLEIGDKFPYVYTVIIIQLYAGSAVLALLPGIVFKVETGLQNLVPVRLSETASSVSQLPALYVAIFFKFEIVALIFLYLVVPFSVKLFAAFGMALRRLSAYPTSRDLTYRYGKILLKSGWVFVVINTTQAVTIYSDPIMITSFLGPREVAAYSISQRLFSVPVLFSNFLFVAQWPAYSHALASGNTRWIKRSFAVGTGLTVLATLVFSLILALHYDLALSIWGLSDDLHVSGPLLAGMVAYTVGSVMFSSCATLLASLEVRGPQIFASLAMLVGSLGLSLILIPVVGSAGAIWAKVLSLAFLLLPIYSVPIYRIFSEQKSQ